MNINKENETLNVCPHCNGDNVIKYGKYNGRQRYKCKSQGCGCTFIEDHYYVFKYSKKFKYMWKDYYKLIVEGRTIRECAAILKITIVTSFMWRHKILNNFKSENKVDILRQYVELTKMLCKENLKGSRHITSDKRAMINIISVLDLNKNIISFPISKIPFHMLHLNNIVFPRIDNKAYAVGHQDRRLEARARKHNDINKNTNDSNDKVDFRLSIKQREWMKRFYGVATRFIDHYLEWYNYFYRNNNELDEDNMFMTTYIKWKDINNKIISFES